MDAKEVPLQDTPKHARRVVGVKADQNTGGPYILGGPTLAALGMIGVCTLAYFVTAKVVSYVRWSTNIHTLRKLFVTRATRASADCKRGSH